MVGDGGGGGAQGLVLATAFSPPAMANPVAQLQTRYKELENGFRAWLGKQSVAVEAAIVTVTGAAQGASIGGIMGFLTEDASAVLQAPSQSASGAMASLKNAQALAGGPLVQARNFAVMSGANAGISCIMRRVRGVEDVQSSMVAAFGSGALFTLVSGMGGPNQAMNAITSGLFFALVQGGLYTFGQKLSKPGQKLSKPPAEDAYYSKTRSMLTGLGLQNYENNFKKGLLTDNTLPLLTDSALQDVNIPPGPRLLILDHVHRLVHK